MKNKGTKKTGEILRNLPFFRRLACQTAFFIVRIDFDRTVWQGQKDSNPRPMVLETSTLPAELYPYRTHTIILDFCAFVKGFLQNKTENIKKETEDFFLPPFVCHCLLCNSFAHGLLLANHAQRKNFPPSALTIGAASDIMKAENITLSKIRRIR